MKTTNSTAVLAKLTSKNQLTLPKSVTEALGPVQYFEVQAEAGQIILTPVRIQRGDAVRAKLAELSLDERSLDAALAWAELAAQPATARRTPAKKKAAAVAAGKAPARKTATRKSVAAKPEQAPKRRTR